MKLFESKIEQPEDTDSPNVTVKLTFPEPLFLLEWARKENIKFSPEEVEIIMNSDRNRIKKNKEYLSGLIAEHSK